MGEARCRVRVLSMQQRLIATVAFASRREHCCVILNAHQPSRCEREAQRILYTRLLAFLERNKQRDLLFAQLRFISHAQGVPAAPAYQPQRGTASLATVIASVDEESMASFAGALRRLRLERAARGV
jgi:hypothetical protein